MRIVKRIGLVLVAVFAMSVVAESAAEATSGPVYMLGSHELENGKTLGIIAEANGNQVLKAATITITCKKVGALSGVLVGKGLTTGGTSEEILDYTECSQSGDGASCTVLNGAVTTNLLENRQGFTNSTKTGPLLTGFKPKSSGVFATLLFTGTCTFGSSNAVELGTGDKLGVICNAQNELGDNVEVGVREVIQKKNEISCPSTAIKAMWYETAGALAEEKAGLKVAGIATAEYIGKSFVSLTSGTEWGLRTK
jgi:hypothetical protein